MVDLDQCKTFDSDINFLGDFNSSLSLKIFSFDDRVT